MVDIAVVIPTCGRPALLERCLRALAVQTLGGDNFECIVVVDRPTEASLDATRRLAATLRAEGALAAIRVLPNRRGPGPAGARNTGWRGADAALIAFTDDDTVPAPDWLRAALAAWAERGAAEAWVAMAGRVEVPAISEPPSDHELMTRGLACSEFVTANAFVARTALQRIGGFDERFARPWREDSDLQFRLEAIGPVGRTEATVVHPVRDERWGLSLRQQRNAYFDALLYKKHPREYRRRIRPTPPWDYYAIVGAALAAVPLALAGMAAAWIIGLSLLATTLALRLALRRLAGTARTPRHALEMLLTSLAIPFLSVYWRLRGALRFRVLFL